MCNIQRPRMLYIVISSNPSPLKIRETRLSDTTNFDVVCTSVLYITSTVITVQCTVQVMYSLEVEWSGVIRLTNIVLCTLFVYLIISQMAHTVDSSGSRARHTLARIGIPHTQA